MNITGAGKRLSIVVNENDRLGHTSLHDALMRKAHDLGLAGASAWHGVAGYGAGNQIHTAKVLRLADDLPVVITMVDSEEKIRAAVPPLEEMIEAARCGALMTIETVEVITYAQGKAPGA